MALAGLGLVCWLVVTLWDEDAARPVLWHVFLLWCVGVPYWHYVEYRTFLRRDSPAEARDDFLVLQALSRTVWLGVAVLLAVALLRR
jgi:hypothetical protein